MEKEQKFTDTLREKRANGNKASFKSQLATVCPLAFPDDIMVT